MWQPKALRAIGLWTFITTNMLIDCLKIKELRVPSIIEVGTTRHVILDCDYDIEHDPELNRGLVIKWFHNDNDLIYQWIPPKNKPQDLKILRGRLNLTHKASNDPLKMHRALDIVRLTPVLTGKYTCVVSTYLDEVRASKRMVVLDKEDKFELAYSKHDDNTIKVTCLATNISPRPNLTLYDSNRLLLNLDGQIDRAVSNDQDRLFDVSTHALVKVADDETFTCELRIPQANYTIRKEVYFSWQLLEETSPSNEISLQMSGNISGLPAHRVSLCIIITTIIFTCIYTRLQTM